ncbi:MAG: glycerol-3-phosphate dehydrogenase [Rhizobiales bacterium]|nr:glycerol-3-phosphate dehydrogenase [Hyphomicrobiales bacterium]
MNENAASEVFDLAIVGGGVNGCGIARDAAGRGLKVVLLEQGDLGQATSSASTKLFHGGLRYLEHFEFRLVREALIEREVLLGAMPHISWPLSFVLPHHKGLRPAWLLRLGLFFYDHLGGRKILPASRSLDLRTDPAGAPLKSVYVKGFEYPDCWVDDSRLVVLNARDAASHGADIRVRTRFEGARRAADGWSINTTSLEEGASRQLQARVLINAGGPWVDEILTGRVRLGSPGSVRLVRGSHIVVRKLFDHDRAYIFQNSDGRIVFAIPYEDDYTLIGTTDEDHDGDPADAVCTEAEAAYLCAAVSEYFSASVSPADIVWTYSGVRPLYDDGASSATEATRDYVLDLNVQGGDEAGAAPLLNVFGGKITTYRRLAEAALTKLGPYLPGHAGPWTRDASLPGGDMEVGGAGALTADLCARYPFIDEPWACRLVRTYGTDAAKLLGAATSANDLGLEFGAKLTEREVDWLITHEWARSADDVLWRRTKLGIRFTADETARLDEWMRRRLGASAAIPAEEAGNGPGIQ